MEEKIKKKGGNEYYREKIVRLELMNKELNDTIDQQSAEIADVTKLYNEETREHQALEKAAEKKDKRIKDLQAKLDRANKYIDKLQKDYEALLTKTRDEMNELAKKRAAEINELTKINLRHNDEVNECIALHTHIEAEMLRFMGPIRRKLWAMYAKTL